MHILKCSITWYIKLAKGTVHTKILMIEFFQVRNNCSEIENRTEK